MVLTYLFCVKYIQVVSATESLRGSAARWRGKVCGATSAWCWGAELRGDAAELGEGGFLLGEGQRLVDDPLEVDSLALASGQGCTRLVLVLPLPLPQLPLPNTGL